jgi:hypothetical protein
LNDKFLELATPVIGEAGARALLGELWRTDKLGNVEFETQARPVEAFLLAAEGRR